MRFYHPDQEQAPLFVVLHTWSGTYKQDLDGLRDVLDICQSRGWALIMPNYRGPNKRPEACASDLAIQDVLDAVKYAKEKANINDRRVYVIGGSGGGHMSLMMAAKAPELWAGVSAWVPIVDLSAWHRQCKQADRKYWRDLENVCNGPPDQSKEIKRCYQKRSPIYFLDRAEGVKIDINVGIHDGHTGSVPVTHSIRAFNKLARVNNRADRAIKKTFIRTMRQEQTVPDELRWTGEQPDVREKPILFRREAGPVRLSIFDGGHEMDLQAGVKWLSKLKKPE